MTLVVQPLGDAALVVTFASELSALANARVHALAASLRERPLATIRGAVDIVPAMVSLTVHVEPGTAERIAGDLRARAEDVATDASLASAVDARPVREIAVRYGGDAGPDLADVAAFARCTPAEVAARHAAHIYRVYMLGFLPGFAYLGDVDASIAAPRRATPRTRVPAGSVGIAGLQTGIYPQASPGGWQIIGHTDARMFDASAGALLQPGDRVRFVISTDGARSSAFRDDEAAG